MKSTLAVLLLATSLAACSHSGTAPTASPAASQGTAPANNAPGSEQGSPPGSTTPATSSGPASAGAADIAAAATTQQEGADTGTSADSSEAALERIAALPAAGQLPASQWVAGTNYQVLSPAQPTDVPTGKVEVIEMFWYACPHCYALDPTIESWRRNKPAYIDFRRVPVMWNEEHRAHAHLFYTLQALGKLDQLHSKVFDEIHRKGDLLYTEGDDKATLQSQLQFAKANGISESDFMNAYNSFGVQNSLQQADDLVRRDRIDSVPTIVIDGKFVSDAGMAGSPAKLMQLIDAIAASEKHR
jgi:protein dithiol oxidoreductase (disulfide-forming)